jgi:hypothetical protein
MARGKIRGLTLPPSRRTSRGTRRRRNPKGSLQAIRERILRAKARERPELMEELWEIKLKGMSMAKRVELEVMASRLNPEDRQELFIKLLSQPEKNLR